eukprot:scaffold8606_cov117-Isochrysis_galbana.AAC.4
MSGTRSAPLLGVAYGLGPETATDSRVRRANARVGCQDLTEDGHPGRYLKSHGWLDGACQALRPIGRLPT